MKIDAIKLYNWLVKYRFHDGIIIWHEIKNNIIFIEYKTNYKELYIFKINMHTNTTIECAGKSVIEMDTIKFILNLQLYYRTNFRKKLLAKKLKVYDEKLTEWQNMQLNNYDRIWDCGNFKYELTIDK